MTNRLRSVLNIVLFSCMVTMNYLANALPLNGITQREISAQYQIYLTPAGYVFAIWGLIYLGLTAYICWQALPHYVDNRRLRSLDLPFGISCLCNILWLVVWHYRYLSVSVFFMLGLLTSLIWIYKRLDAGRQDVNKAALWLVEKTFSVYLGWVSLATMLNIAIWLYTYGWNGAPLAPQSWAVILLLVAASLYLFIGFSRRDAAILGVLSWATIGIGIKHQNETMIWYTGLLVASIGGIAALYIALNSKKPDAL